MPGLKLTRLPDRTPMKLIVLVTPELHDRLEAYVRAYTEAYGSPEPIAELVPAMLAAFLDSDRAFARATSRGTK